jgi:glycosyltransferase involved in cell wall biosynthesis
MASTWVITRANNREAIEAALPAIAERDRLRFVYVDLPRWLSFWKRGGRGIHLYYLLWQFAALRRARQLLREREFSAVWHVTFANIWLGSVAPLTRLPFIYGPVGGGVRTSVRLFPALGPKGARYEVTRGLIRAISRHLNPLCDLAIRRAKLIMVQNPETREWISRSQREKAVIFPNTLVEGPVPSRATRLGGSRTALFVGNLHPLKGIALAVRAIALAPGWRLSVCGTGPDEARLRRMARRLGAQDRVEFLGWRPRREVLRLMAEEADVLLFPSLHDEGGMVVAEAVSIGLPVVCLDRGGAPGLGGAPVKATGVRETSRALARAMMSAPPQAGSSRFSLDSATDRVSELFARVGVLDGRFSPRVGPNAAGSPTEPAAWRSWNDRPVGT